ncbi:MAG: hypothetical protein K8R64_06785 [Methanosarcinaceae archaeon]|nr:hypothetical protein [Methanosarcinaceae archaeon]
MVQSEVALETYYSYWAGPMPAAEITWMVVILIISAFALWQARTFARKFM